MILNEFQDFYFLIGIKLRNNATESRRCQQKKSKHDFRTRNQIWYLEKKINLTFKKQN